MITIRTLTERLRRRRAHPRQHREDGFGGIEVLPIGVLVITIVSFVVISAWSVIDAKLAATGAAREATRTAVEEFDFGAGKNAGLEAWHAQHRSETPNVNFVGDLSRCGRVTATVTAEIETVHVPILRSWGTITVRSVHSEVTDPYRNAGGALSGEADCG
jgi:Flp pilus assembly protein TadG